jgi:tRNA A37 threonylcarbamoyladenosine dehydratase
MAQRVAAINPACRTWCIQSFVARENAAALLARSQAEHGGFHFLLDAIDNVDDKAAILKACVDSSTPVLTVGAAGGRLDPTAVRVGDLATCTGDPLLARLRRKLRQRYGFPYGSATSSDGDPPWNIRAVHSLEPPPPPATAQSCPAPAGQGMRPCDAGYGSSCMATGAFGLAAAAAAVEAMLGAPRDANVPRVVIAPERVRTKPARPLWTPVRPRRSVCRRCSPDRSPAINRCKWMKCIVQHQELVGWNWNVHSLLSPDMMRAAVAEQLRPHCLMGLPR